MSGSEKLKQNFGEEKGKGAIYVGWEGVPCFSLIFLQLSPHGWA